MASMNSKHSDEIKHIHLVSDTKLFLQVSLYCLVWGAGGSTVREGHTETRASWLTWCWPYERLNKHYATWFVEMSRLDDALFLLHTHTKTHSKCPEKEKNTFYKWRFLYIHLFLYVVVVGSTCVHNCI